MPCPSCSLRTVLMAAIVPLGVAALVVGVGAWSRSPEAVPSPGEKPVSSFVLDHKFTLIDGTPTSLKAYEGKVILIVNTASKCGLTPQYEGLEALYRAHKEEGLVVIGFPANNFMGQEPGTNEEILAFCTGKYEVSFPMAAKISVKGEGCHPLYKHLAALPEPLGGEPTWNFTKFVVDRSGQVVARFGPRTAPEDAKVTETLAGLLSGG